MHNDHQRRDEQYDSESRCHPESEGRTEGCIHKNEQTANGYDIQGDCLPRLLSFSDEQTQQQQDAGSKYLNGHASAKGNNEEEEDKAQRCERMNRHLLHAQLRKPVPEGVGDLLHKEVYQHV